MEVIPSARKSWSIPKVDYCFDLKLGESNADTYPEFSWKDLVKEVHSKDKSAPDGGNRALDPYASDDDDALKALAAKFEKRYNENGAERKRRKRKAEDYIDRGAGYDETDSFIDNSEVYDELVPEDMQTLHGGFYINSGRLDFKDADVSDCDVDEEIEEVRKTTGRKFSKQIVKKSLAQANKASAKKKRAINAEGVSKSKTNGTKKVDSTKQPVNSSPVSGKIRTIIVSSHSDSSSSDSSGSTSSSSSSPSDKDRCTPPNPKVVPAPAAPKPPPPSKPISTAANTAAKPHPVPRRLKVKNIPYSKPHSDMGAPQTPGQSTPKTATPSSNREIFGSLLPNVSGVNIPSGLSATSILPAPATIRTTVPVPTISPRMTMPSPRHFGNPGPMPKSAKMRRRVTDRVGTGIARKASLPPASPAAASPARKKQRLDQVPPSPRPVPVKKPRKPRASAANRTNPTPASEPRALTAEEHHQMLIQHLQRHPQLSSIGLGLSHLLPLIPPTLPAIPPNLAKEPRRQQSKTAASDVLKNLASFQSQLGAGVTVSEVKKTKPHTMSPNNANSPKSNTPPSRLSTPSPIHVPRIPIPSSITVTASNPRSQGQQQRSTSSIATASPPFQTVQTNKTYTDFHMNALLSKPFNGNSSK